MPKNLFFSERHSSLTKSGSNSCSGDVPQHEIVRSPRSEVLSSARVSFARNVTGQRRDESRRETSEQKYERDVEE